MAITIRTESYEWDTWRERVQLTKPKLNWRWTLCVSGFLAPAAVIAGALSQEVWFRAGMITYGVVWAFTSFIAWVRADKGDTHMRTCDASDSKLYCMMQQLYEEKRQAVLRAEAAEEVTGKLMLIVEPPALAKGCKQVTGAIDDRSGYREWSTTTSSTRRTPL